ncbi:hypothetical protein ACFQVD_26575 [Streptosporangium amethystogenes subsp. fukuiense]|uniref:Uncharacterized protein n=1 Tax=Streptosporangium amethystogenes subsp. fukuiense TaxID=698418 RepID=A0ABW2T7I4_9ACTN
MRWFRRHRGSRAEDLAADKIRDLRDIQGWKGTWNSSDYMRGLYNGLELALSVLEGERAPQFKDAPAAQGEEKG